MLPAFVLGALRQHQQQQRARREEAGAAWQEKDIVFCGRNGRYFGLTSLDYHFKRLLESADLPNIRFHDLRHSAATILLSIGVHPKVVQELLGHSTISMTLDIYSHVLPSMHQEAMSKLDDLFGSQEQTRLSSWVSSTAIAKAVPPQSSSQGALTIIGRIARLKSYFSP